MLECYVSFSGSPVPPPVRCVIAGPVLFTLLLFFLSAWIEAAQAQTPTPGQPDALFPRLLAAIRQIQIIDNHAHPALPGDPEMDALTFEPAGLAAMESFPLPLRLRPTNSEYVQALHLARLMLHDNAAKLYGLP